MASSSLLLGFFSNMKQAITSVKILNLNLLGSILYTISKCFIQQFCFNSSGYSVGRSGMLSYSKTSCARRFLRCAQYICIVMQHGFSTALNKSQYHERLVLAMISTAFSKICQPLEKLQKSSFGKSRNQKYESLNPQMFSECEK